MIHQIQRYRIKERIRFYIYQVLQATNEDDDGTTTTSTKVKATEFQSWGESSIVQTLVNGNNALSSHLHCTKITLKSGTGLVPKVSTAVEIYYVLGGKGSFRQEGVEECVIGVQDHVIVQPWT